MRSIKFKFKLRNKIPILPVDTHTPLEYFPNHRIKICLGLIDSEERPHLSNFPTTNFVAFDWANKISLLYYWLNLKKQ